MQKWLTVVVLTLGVMVAAMGMRNVTVQASSGDTQVAMAAWGGTPVPKTPWTQAWGGTPVPKTPWMQAKWGGTPVPKTPWMQ